MSAPDDVRWGSIQERDKTFVQTTEQDVREKGTMLPQRINDTFLQYADEIDFCFRDAVDGDAVLSAKWLRNEQGDTSQGTLEIVDEERYNQIKSIHNQALEKLNMPDLKWEDTVEARSQIMSAV